jgi:hypothetical protein
MNAAASNSNRKHDVPLLFKYTTARTAATVIASRSLRFSSPLLFNDPFDVPRDFDLGFTFDQLNSAIATRLGEYLNGDTSPRSSSAETLVTAMKSRLHQKSAESLLKDVKFVTKLFVQEAFERSQSKFQQHWDDRVPGMRICCFSETQTSAAMWAHYGDQHRGAVLQFASSDEHDSVSLLARPVIYQSVKPTLPPVEVWARTLLSEIEWDWDAFLKEYFFAKSAEWSYEREYRVATHKSASEEGLFSDLVFHAEDLRGVVLGASISPDDEQLLVAMLRLKYPHASVYRANLDRQAMAMRIALERPGAT